VDKVLENVADTIGDTDLSKMVNIIEKKLLEEDYTSLDLAAALLKMMMGEENEDIIDTREPRSLDDLESLYGGGNRARGGRNGNSRGGRNDSSREDMARLFINIGKNQNVKPGDILGAIAGESGMPGKMVGSIDMYDKYTFVEVPRESADTVLQAMKDVKIKGKNIHMEKANGKGR
jgi:ATP-dependent RNA helicase DeaD